MSRPFPPSACLCRGHHRSNDRDRVEGEDATRLERLAKARGKKAANVVAELLREPEASPAKPARASGERLNRRAEGTALAWGVSRRPGAVRCGLAAQYEVGGTPLFVG